MFLFLFSDVFSFITLKYIYNLQIKYIEIHKHKNI